MHFLPKGTTILLVFRIFSQAVRKFLKKKNHAYINFVRNGRPENKLEGIQKMLSEGEKMIEDAIKITFVRLGKL